jgi:hypothetical protein
MFWTTANILQFTALISSALCTYYTRIPIVCMHVFVPACDAGIWIVCSYKQDQKIAAINDEERYLGIR